MREFPCIDMVATGKQIRALRRAQGLRVEDVSDYMGFTGPQAVYKWQRGECLPDVVNLLALSRLLKTPMENILRERQEEGDKPSSQTEDKVGVGFVKIQHPSFVSYIF